MKLSVAVITYNEERKLAATLSAVASIADEIVVVDSYSVDRTVEVAKSFNATVVLQSWLGYGPQRNFLMSQCSGEWILMIDADEVLTPEAVADVRKQIETGTFSVYSITSKSYFLDRPILHGGWSGTKKIRLFKKEAGAFNENIVHEMFETRERVGLLKGYLRHYTYLDLEDYLRKFNRYTSEGALERLKRGKKSTMGTILLRSSYKFFQQYILRLGFLDGAEGFILAYFSASYAFAVYSKLREYHRKGVTYEMVSSKRG